MPRLSASEFDKKACAALHPGREVGKERSSISVASLQLIDTNILVYRYDHRFPDKQEAAIEFLRQGIQDGCLRIPHQAIIEFVAAVTRSSKGVRLLEPFDARREAEEIMAQFPVLFPNHAVLRTALRGAAAYQLSWFDAHLWAYAEVFGIQELISEDFQDGRIYGSVRVRNPFLGRDA